MEEKQLSKDSVVLTTFKVALIMITIIKRKLPDANVFS